MPEISVIVPVYNVEKYLDRCVVSILNQTYTNFECILVDDGSPDNSPKICDDYQKKDRRVKVIHKSNGGLSDARNAGLEVCSGKYIFFIDSDDWIHPQTLEILYYAAKKSNAGIISCKEIKTTSYLDNFYIYDLKEINKVKIYNKNEILDNFLEEFFWKIRPYAWGKLYKRECFDKVKYNVSMRLYEDEYIYADIIEAANAVVCLEHELYYYYQSPESLMRGCFSERFILTLKSLQHISDFMYDRQIYHERDLFEFKWMMAYMDLYYRIKNEAPELMKELKVYKYSFRSKYINLLKNPVLTRAYKVLLILFAISPMAAEKLYRKLIR